MTIGPPISEIQFDLENSRSKVKVKGTLVSAVSSWFIYLVFHVRASYRLSSLSFHDNQASHSRDTIPRIKNSRSKVKVKVQGQRYPSQHSIQLTHFLLVSHRLDQPFLRYGKCNVRRQKTNLKFYAKNCCKKIAYRIYPKLNHMKSMIRGIYLKHFVAIG